MTPKEFYREIKKRVIFEMARMGYPRKGFSIAHHQRNTSGEKSPNGDWESYWEENHYSHHFPLEPHKCPSCLEHQSTFVGSHILVSEKAYIAPICKHCNDTYKGGKADEHYFYVRTKDMVRVPEH